MSVLLNQMWNYIDKILLACLKLIFKTLHKDLNEKIENDFMQFVKFGIVGVSNTVISYGIYLFSLLVLNYVGGVGEYNYLVAQIVAFLLSVLWSYYWNNKMVFVIEDGKSRSVIKSLIKTYVSYSFTGLFLNSILLVLWVDIIGISEFISPIINLVISVPLNFVINKLWAFKASD